MLGLPQEIAAACAPLFEAVPLESAMPRLLGTDPHHTQLVEEALSLPALAGRPHLTAGLWLYVDDLDRSHRISQGLADSTGAYWHMIMHRREGDFSNSRYWRARVGDHPLIAERPDLDPESLIAAAEADGGRNQPDLVARQREEWAALFSWCASHPSP